MSDEYLGAIIVIGHPRLPEGPLEMRCMTCPKRRPVYASTLLTITQLKKQDKKYVVLCWDCYMLARKSGLPQLGVHGNIEGRQILGIVS